MNIDFIKNMPTVRNSVHESCYKSFQILLVIKEMLRRGDSKETITELIAYLEGGNN